MTQDAWMDLSVLLLAAATAVILAVITAHIIHFDLWRLVSHIAGWVKESVSW
jgi:hypothetical protein